MYFIYNLLKEKFCILKDDLLVYQQIEVLQQKCLSCKSSNHFLRQCHLINYIPNKVSIINKTNQSEPQIRKSYKRINKKMNCRGNYMKIIEKMNDFKAKNPEEFTSYAESSFDFTENEEEIESFSLENFEKEEILIDNQENLKNDLKKSLNKSEHHHSIEKFKNLSIKTNSSKLRPAINKNDEQNPQNPIFPEKNLIFTEKSPTLKKTNESVKNQKNNEFLINPKIDTIQEMMSSDIKNFESLKNYKFYYPHNNISHVLKHCIRSPRNKKHRKKSVYHNLNRNIQNFSGFFKKGNVNKK